MTDKPQETYNQSIMPRELILGLNLNTGQVPWTEIVSSAANQHRNLKPFAAILPASNTTTDVTEGSSSAINPTLIVRNDLSIDEDTWLKDMDALLYIQTSQALAAPGISVELSATYVNPQGQADLAPFYDQTVTLAAGTGNFKATLPTQSLQKLVAKGGKILFVITIIATLALAGTIALYSTFHGSNEASFIRIRSASANTSKDTELTMEKLPT